MRSKLMDKEAGSVCLGVLVRGVMAITKDQMQGACRLLWTFSRMFLSMESRSSRTSLTSANVFVMLTRLATCLATAQTLEFSAGPHGSAGL